MRYFIFTTLFSAIFLTSCANTKSLEKGHFRTKETIGILVKPIEFHIVKKGVFVGSNPITIAVSAGATVIMNKKKGSIEDSVMVVLNQDDITPTDEIAKLFLEIHEKYGVECKIIDVDLREFPLEKHKPTMQKLKQADMDYTVFGEKYDIDRLLLIDVKNEVNNTLLDRVVVTKVTPLTIDMDNNTFLYASMYKKSKQMSGKWKKSENFEELTDAIDSNIEEVIKKISVRFRL